MANPYVDALLNNLRFQRDVGLGFGENALAIGSGMAAQVPAGLHGLSDLLRGRGVERAAQRTRDTAEALTYEPRTDVGRRGLENVGKAIETVTEPAKQHLVDPIGDRSPVLGAAILAGAELIGPKGAKPKVKAPTPKPKVTQEALAAQLRAMDERITRQRAALAGPDVMEAQRVAGEQGLADMLREREGIRVQHDSMYDRMMSDAPRYDPGSPQQLIPGVDPLSLDEAHGLAQDRYRQARGEMSFEDRNRALRFEYDPDWTGAALGSSQLQPGAWAVDYLQESIPGGGYRSQGKRPAREVPGSRVFRRDLEDQTTRTIPQGEFSSPNTVRAEVGAENKQQMMARLERLREAEREAIQRGEESALTRARNINAGLARRRALLAEPGINDAQRLQLNEEILAAKRNRPVEVDDERVRMAVPHPQEGLFAPIEWRDLLGDAVSQPDSTLIPLGQQAALVRRLRGEPEPTPPRRPATRGARAPESSRDPAAMNAESVQAFLDATKENPAMFQFGLMPPRGVRSLEDFADYFSRQSNEPVNVDWTSRAGDDYDEPSKIKVEKTHGRGEVMRDRWGDYKSRQKEHERGDYPMYDEYGDVKKVEVPGPLPKGEEGPLLAKKRAQGGEPLRDYRGDPKYEYKKSEGGEPMRDERGRIKERWEDNPDYRGGDEYDVAEISGPSGSIEVTYADPAYIGATGASRANKAKKASGAGGQLLYQVALAHASRQGIPITGGSLTDINQYRLLSNVLSNIARSGVNTRDLAGTLSGNAPRARGEAKGPEVWRAEAEEGRYRLRSADVNPERVKFDPEKGFSIDGQPATAADIRKQIGELSPAAGQHDWQGGVGQKSLMRNAVFEWLRHATPEQAAAVAKKWPKEWGPIFAGLGALGVGVGAMQEEPQMAE